MYKSVSFISTALKRHSGRQYIADKFVSQEQIATLIEAARWAPSCYGDEPWRYILCNKESDSEAWEKLLSCLVEFNQGWAKNAPLLIASVAKKTFAFNGASNGWGHYDTGAASMNICHAAVDLGLMAHQMAGFDPAAVSKAFGIGEDYQVLSVIAVGYEVENPTDLAERKRKPIDDIFFFGNFKN